VLATVLLVLVILLSIFLSAMTYALARYGHHAGERSRLVASHLSEAGVHRWINQTQLGGKRFASGRWQAPNGGSILVEAFAWGPYLMLKSDGILGSTIVTSYALVGSVPSKLFTAALTIGDETTPLVVAGHSHIIGDVNTGSGSIMPGRIRGEGAPEEGFLEGLNNLLPVVELPQLDTAILSTYMRNMEMRKRSPLRRCAGSLVLGNRDDDFLNHGDCVQVENSLTMDGAAVTHFGNPQSLFAGGSIDICADSRLSGLIELVAQGTIRISDSAIVDACVLWANDSIIIENDAHFSGIAITPGTLVVRDLAVLAYPSLLLADSPTDAMAQTGGIRLRSSGRLESMCILRHDHRVRSSSNSTRLLYVDTATTFIGFLLSEDQTDIRGRLYGSAATELFQYIYPPSTYVNWLRDVYVNRRALNHTPALPVLTAPDGRCAYRIIRRDRAL